MRNTPQSTVVLEALVELEHATNARLLQKVRSILPDISATTVHRITTRLIKEGKISTTRVSYNGAIILDKEPLPHHHFNCAPCGGLRDIQIPPELVQNITQQVCSDIEADSLVINGVCKKCKENK